MTDMREKQPDNRTLDFRRDTRGAYSWVIEIEVWPYSSIKNEDVYSRNVTVLCNAENSIQAHRYGDMISYTISLAHDVWQTNIWSVSRAPFGE
jgi:hypothetical protein